MTLLYYDDWENILNLAGKIDDRLDCAWLELVGDNEYQTLLEFFDKSNYPHENDWGEWEEVNTNKALKKIIRGKDCVALINYAFLLGQLVGRAGHIAETND